MKRTIEAFLVMVCLLLCATVAVAEKSEVKAGYYENGWPAFSVTYPTQWQEKTPEPGIAFRAEAPEGVPSLRISVFYNRNGIPLPMAANVVMTTLSRIGKNVRLLTNEGSKLDDGTPVQESVIGWESKSGRKLSTLFLAAEKDAMWIMISISDTKEIGEEHKKAVYSLKIKPGKAEPVKLPAGIRALLDQYSEGLLKHDLAKAMSHYSDRYMYNGSNKKAIETWTNTWINGITASRIDITVFEPKGDKAYLAGYSKNNYGVYPFSMHIIKENGQWKYYGNQKKRQPWTFAE